MADLSEDHFCFAGTSPWFDHRASVAELAEQLEKSGVKKAFAVSLDAVSAAEKITANSQWLNEVGKYPVIRPLAVVDLRDMPQAMRQLEQMENFAGIWLSPYLHNYRLDDPRWMEFFRRCYDLQIPLWINVTLSDDRFRRRGLTTRSVNENEIIDFARKAPANRYIIQGAVGHNKLLAVLPANIFLEYSRLSDGEYLAEDFRCELSHLCRGSEYPFRSYDSVDDVLLGKI